MSVAYGEYSIDDNRCRESIFIFNGKMCLYVFLFKMEAP